MKPIHALVLMVLVGVATLSTALAQTVLDYDVPRDPHPFPLPLYADRPEAGALVQAGGTVAQGPAAKPAAVVNGEPISLAEVERIAAFLIKEKFTLSPPTSAQKTLIQRDVVNMLIDDLLMRQFLAKHGPKVTAAEVDQEFNNFVKEQTKDGKKLEDFYRDSGQTEKDIRIDLQTMLQWAGYVKEQVKEEHLKRYYDANKEFFDQVTVRASHILKQLPENATESDKKLAREKLTQLRQEIVAGTLDFAEAAKKESQCPVSAGSGGDIGYFPRKLLYAESFTAPAFALKVGEVSGIVETPYGLHLIKVTDRKVGRISEFDKIRDEVREFYVEELRIGMLADEREKAKIDIHIP